MLETSLNELFFISAICSFLQKIKTMIIVMTYPAAPNVLREPGGTEIAIGPIWTDYTSMVPMPLLLMESIGTPLGGIITH